ncbi:unnamed protein product [Boreogadus saida]
MVLGETGAGKSTLVNGMINYILGVTWDSTFKLKLVDEGKAKSQAHSQTSEVTVYKLNHREVTEKRIYKDLKEKYEEASKNAMPVEEVIKKMELDPIHPSTSEYIDLLIEGEKSEAKPGYLERIKELQHMREKVITMGKVARGDKVL